MDVKLYRADFEGGELDESYCVITEDREQAVRVQLVSDGTHSRFRAFDLYFGQNLSVDDNGAVSRPHRATPYNEEVGRMLTAEVQPPIRNIHERAKAAEVFGGLVLQHFAGDPLVGVSELPGIVTIKIA